MNRKRLTPNEKTGLLDIYADKQNFLLFERELARYIILHADNEPALVPLAHFMFQLGDDNDA